ncbi:DUF4296 domain-containing protein [Pseudoflavitalea sp. X16]|uniref:DUF4296 domain-containing protein n=1 Tax=Paraflavitalea devenefica TaxID=2716334 RepID=UPI0014213951|nr:DUF4296 domain-containing protein [Paraflavitalea devenefica]NII27112.1 DUF4296 domain-containing protein [Paraflavitalea devenefica]
MTDLLPRIAGCLLIVLLAACTNKNKVPSDVLPREKMEKVMWDMIQADRFSSQFLEKDSAKLNVKTETFKLYEKVFLLHKITRDEFVHSFKFYLSRPDINRELFDSLSAHANNRRAEMYTNPDTSGRNDTSGRKARFPGAQQVQ